MTARHDFWNTALATMAFLEWLDGDRRLSKSFASLPEVPSALDRVFRPEPAAAGRIIPAALRLESPAAKPAAVQGTPRPASGGPATMILVGRGKSVGAATEGKSD